MAMATDGQEGSPQRMVVDDLLGAVGAKNQAHLDALRKRGIVPTHRGQPGPGWIL